MKIVNLRNETKTSLKGFSKGKPRKPSTGIRLEELVGHLFELNRNLKDLIGQNNQLIQSNYSLTSHLYGEERAGSVVVESIDITSNNECCPNPKMRDRLFKVRRKDDVAVMCVNKNGAPNWIAYHNELEPIINTTEKMNPNYIRGIVGEKTLNRLLDAHKQVLATARPVTINIDFEHDGMIFYRSLRLVPCASGCFKILCFIQNRKPPTEICCKAQG